MRTPRGIRALVAQHLHGLVTSLGIDLVDLDIGGRLGRPELDRAEGLWMPPSRIQSAWLTSMLAFSWTVRVETARMSLKTSAVLL